MATNTESLAAYHVSQSHLHFYNQGKTSTVFASPSNPAEAISSIYTTLFKTERELVKARLGAKPGQLTINKESGRSNLALEIEQSFLKILNIKDNPIIYNYTKEIELGYQAIVDSDIKNLEVVIENIKKQFNEAGKYLKNFSDFTKFLNDFTNSPDGGLLTKLGKEGITKGEIIGSYFGHTRRIFGLVGELNFVYYAHNMVNDIEIATGLILEHKKASLVTAKTETGKATVGDANISIRIGPLGSETSISFPVSIKSSKRDDTKTFHAYGGNPIPHLHSSGLQNVLVDFVNIYLSKQTGFRSLLAAMIADFGLAGRGSDSVETRPLFLVKQTPNSVGIYFFFELYYYYAKNAKNISEIPSISISNYKYLTAAPSKLDKINNKLVKKLKTAEAEADVTTGRTFFRAAKKEKMQRSTAYMNYDEIKDRVTMKASLTAVWPKFKDTRVSSMSEVVREMDFYRKKKTE